MVEASSLGDDDPIAVLRDLEAVVGAVGDPRGPDGDEHAAGVQLLDVDALAVLDKGGSNDLGSDVAVAVLGDLEAVTRVARARGGSQLDGDAAVTVLFEAMPLRRRCRER